MLDYWPAAVGFAVRWAADAVVIVLALRLGQRFSGAPLQIRTPLGLMWVFDCGTTFLRTDDGSLRRVVSPQSSQREPLQRDQAEREPAPWDEFRTPQVVQRGPVR